MKGDVCHPMADLFAERGRAGGRVQDRMEDCSEWEEVKCSGKAKEKVTRERQEAEN